MQDETLLSLANGACYCTFGGANASIYEFCAQNLANCANLHTSFETDWFLRRLLLSTPDLDLAANSSVLRKSTKWNREQ
jgi:hypothetical protein